MKIKRKRRAAIESSSVLSDMAFLLIIYFIVIAGFNVNRGFLMNLPGKDSVRTVPRDELLRFSIDEAGELVYKGNIVSFEQASSEIQNAIAERPNTAVMLTINENAPWQSVVSFLDLAQEQKVDSFSFTKEQSEESGS